MADIVLDIATKIVDPGLTIWSVFPGKGRIFHSQFVASKCVFLETPGIKLTAALLEGVVSRDREAEKRFRQHVAMSTAIANYFSKGEKVFPSRQYTGYRAARGSLVGYVRNVFIDMKPDDLVIIGPGSIYEPVHIGEVVGTYHTRDIIHDPAYGREDIPFRRVRWLNTRTERRYLSRHLSQLLSNKRAVIEVNKPTYGEEVFKLAYGDFVFGSDSHYVFPGQKYKNNPRDLSPGSDLLAYFVAASHALESGGINEFAAFDIADAIDKYYTNTDLVSFSVEFSSPGEYIIHAKNAARALLVGLLVAGTSLPTLTYSSALAAEVTNSAASAPDQSTQKLQDDYKSIMDAVGESKFKSLCALNKECQAKIGLKTGVKIKDRRTP